MTEPYYNASYGLGFEGFLNYANELVNGWMVIAFIGMVWIAIIYTLSKTDIKPSSTVAYACFVSLLLSVFFQLFVNVNDIMIFILSIGLAGSIFWSIITGRN